MEKEKKKKWKKGKKRKGKRMEKGKGKREKGIKHQPVDFCKRSKTKYMQAHPARVHRFA